MVTIFSPEMVAFQVNHRKRWKKWWKKRWCLRWMLEISQILSPFLVTILPQNTSFMWSWTEMTSECLKIQRLQSRNSQFCKSRQNVLPTFSHYDVSPASHWSCFSRFYLGWSNLKNIFSNPSSLTETCSTRELLRIAEALALLSKTHLKSLHCLLSKEWDQSASNKEGAMIQTNCHKGYLNKAWRILQRTICVQVVGTFLAYLKAQSSGHCKGGF